MLLCVIFIIDLLFAQLFARLCSSFSRVALPPSSKNPLTSVPLQYHRNLELATNEVQ